MTATAGAARAPVRHTLRGVWSPQLANRRDVDVYLPASLSERSESKGRYPVVYMQDGQNLSDPLIAFAGTWELATALNQLAGQGIEPIVVGVHNSPDRMAEYSPFRDPKHGGGRADAYLSFLARTLKPRIDREFPTRKGAAHTAIVGSSMGGLLSLYAWLRRPDVFGHAGAMSPALWFGRDRLFDFIARAALPRGRLYIDVGTAEGARTLADARALRALVEGKDRARRLRLAYLEERGGQHGEGAWAGRIGGALTFLFGG
jgi:predicted alpha/beta superfamily hydrolase